VAAGETRPGVEPFAGPTSIAVAVMPTEVLNPYFLMATDAHLAAYQDAICRVIEADRRMKIVDRTELDKVWRERQYDLLRGQVRPKPIVSADVFVLSAIELVGTASVLHIQFVHGATASVLDEVRVPIRPQNPLAFDPPLEKVVAGRWPVVLGRLAQVRSRPHWAVAGVYGATAGDLPAAEQIERQVVDALRKDQRLFLCETIDIDAAQEEALMAALGMGRPAVGGFRGEADFLVEGRATGAQVELRVLDGRSLSQIAHGSFKRGEDQQIAQWLTAQVDRVKRAATTSPTATAAADWSDRQARLEFEIAAQLGKQFVALSEAAQQRRLKAGLTKVTEEDAQTLRDLTDRRRQHLTRAAQLNPNDEEIVLAFARAKDDGSMRFGDSARLAQLYERLATQFPKSANHREFVEHALTYYSMAASYLRRYIRSTDWIGVPRGIDHARLRLAYQEKLLHLYESYAIRYASFVGQPEDGYSRGWRSFPGSMINYLYLASTHAYMTKASDQEIQRMVSRWSDIFDSRPAAGPHSDFLRLAMVSLHNDRAGYLALLEDMQKRHPDPKDPYWLVGTNRAQGDLYRLFGNGDNFDQWRRGKRGIGGLPRDGYDLAKDHSEPAALNLE
jgi:hypothetical protein